VKTLYATPCNNDDHHDDNNDNDYSDDSDDSDDIDYLVATSTTVIGMQTHCDISEVHSCLLSTGANSSVVVLVVVVRSLSMVLIVMPSSLSSSVGLDLLCLLLLVL